MEKQDKLDKILIAMQKYIALYLWKTGLFPFQRRIYKQKYLELNKVGEK